MDIADYVLVRLNSDEKSVVTFDCGDIDLNKFLLKDAVKYQQACLSVTHILTLPTDDTVQIAGYFSLLTDKLVFDLDDEYEQKKKEKKEAWKKFNKKHNIHYNKHRKIYPAIKIGRLAAASAFTGKGVGSYLIDSIVTMIIDLKSARKNL
jgi:hypothetical protein